MAADLAQREAARLEDNLTQFLTEAIALRHTETKVDLAIKLSMRTLEAAALAIVQVLISPSAALAEATTLV